MSDKALWRTAAWMSVGICTVTYILFFPVEIPDEGPAYVMGFKIGYFGVISLMAFIPSWLTRFIENRLKRGLRDRTTGDGMPLETGLGNIDRV
jgi:hypothetical protein